MARGVYSFDALGTRWWIDTGGPLPADQQQHLYRMVVAFENNYSRFCNDSLIGRLNDTHVVVSDSAELRAMLTFGLEMFIATDGVFNITVGAQLERAGYGRKPTKRSRVSQAPAKDIWWDESRVYTADHVRLDFGGFGKAWLIDLLVVELDVMGYKQFTVNGGGDIFIRGEQEPIIIEHPEQPNLAIGEVMLADGSICSSSRQKRTWRATDGSAATHIQAVRASGAGMEVASMHVRASTALLADTFATVFLLVPHAKRIELAQHFDLSFMEVRHDGTFWQQPAFGFRPYH